MYHRNILKLISISFLLFFIITTTFSQNFDTQFNLVDTTQVHIVLLKNGIQFKGKITAIENEEVFFSPRKNRKDTIFTLAQIKNIRVQGNLDWNNKNYDAPLEYINYLFFTNTAFRLKKGDRMYRTFMGASILGDVALGDGLSVGLSFSFPLFIAGNIKLGSTFSNARNSHIAFKSTLLVLPLDERFFITENTLIYTLGTPDRFLNIALTNYYAQQRNFFFEYFPVTYNSISVGGGFRMNKNWQLMLENHINFNNAFTEAKVLPSIGVNYSTSRFNFAFGFNSANQSGFNLFPILGFNNDDIAVFEDNVFNRFPYFSFAKLF